MSTDAYGDRGPSAWSGWVMFAAIILIAVGCFNAIQGLAALFKEEVYVIGDSGLLVTTDWTTWGIVLLIWGGILALAGIALLTARGWARWLAMALVVVNLVAQFAFFTSYPLWSLVVIGLDVAVLFALTARWSEVRADLGR